MGSETLSVDDGPVDRTSLLDRAFSVGVVVKGFDGVVELIAGLLLWLAPRTIRLALVGIGAEASEGTSAVNGFIADYAARLDGRLASGTSAFLILFLIGHGVIKIGLVYCLIRKLHRAYPWALGVLVALFVYQAYSFVLTPTVGLGVFAVLDIAIIALAWREYRQLKTVQTAD